MTDKRTKQRIDRLIRQLGDADPNVRWHAARALGKIGKPAVPALINALGDIKPNVRGKAAEALGEIKDASTVPALIKVLGDPDPNVSGNVAGALGKIGKPAIPALIKVLGDTDPDLRWGATWALGKIGDVSAVPALIKALGDTDSHVRWNVAIALGKIKDVSAVPALIKVLGDADPIMRRNAAEALGEIGDEKGIMFKRIIHDKDLEYAESIGLEKVKEVMKEFIGMLWKDNCSRDAEFRINRIGHELAEFYNKIATSIAKKGKGISVKGGELLKATVKPPNGNNGMYRAIGMKQMVRT